MNKSIKKKIEKLLQLAMSNNPHEAELAAQRAVELMQKHSLQREDIMMGEVISRTFEIEYARIPVWIRKLYNGLSYINGCYMVWIHGRRSSDHHTLLKKSKIILTGRECDVLNTEYFLQVFIREIEKKAKQHSQFLGKRRNKRTELQAYRIGLGKGLIDKMAAAMEKYETQQADTHSNLPIAMDDRYEYAKAYYLKNNDVRSVEMNVKKTLSYYLGQRDAKKVDIHRPIHSENDTLVLDYFHI
jgi:hypothetical protein